MLDAVKPKRPRRAVFTLRATRWLSQVDQFVLRMRAEGRPSTKSARG
jgi:hypothetical protein